MHTLMELLTLVYVLLVIAVDLMITKHTSKSDKNREEIVDKNKDKTLPIGFYMGITNMVIFCIALVWTKFGV